MKWCFYVSQPTFCFTKTQWSSQSINPDFSLSNHNDVAWEIPMQSHTTFWHPQHCYCSLKILFYATVGPHISHLLMKVGNMSDAIWADFVLCMKSMELGQAHTKQERTYAHADTHIAHTYTHTILSSTLSQWKSLFTIAELLFSLLMLKCFHHRMYHHENYGLTLQHFAHHKNNPCYRV